MNKLQIKAEILATLRAFSGTTIPEPSLLTDLKNIQDKKTVFEVLVRELTHADEHKSILVCWFLTELIEKEELNNSLWDVIKSPDYNDTIKMVAFNMLKDLGNKIDYEVVGGYFEKFNELINKETKELLDTAIMDPEAQIDFMDFLNALKDNDKISLLKSLEADYAGDALANIIIPVFIYYINTSIADTTIEILSKTKSQLAYHALEKSKKYASGNLMQKINKALTTLKLAGIRIDNTIDFYKEILKESKPFKSYISFPDGLGNLAIIYSRIRPNKTLQFLAVVVNPRFGILDAFGFNSMHENDFYKILDKFYNYNEKYEIEPEIVKYILTQAIETSYDNKDVIPYEYICWESILLDIEPKKLEIPVDKKELNQKEIDQLCLNDLTQNWFYDEITSPEFKSLIEKLSIEYKQNNFSIDLDKFIADNFDEFYTTKELSYQKINFNIAAYLRYAKNDKNLAQIFYSLNENYAFLTNILRKSIYEYFVGKRYLLKNQREMSNKFTQKNISIEETFSLLELDIIISSIEARWVDNA